MDLLATLRQAVMGGKDVHIEDNNVVIDGVTYPGETMTAFTSLQKNVTIIAVVLAWLNRDAKVTQYSKEAKDKKIQMIVATAMKPLQQYLMGEADAAAYLNKDFLSDAAARQATTASTSQTIEDMQSIEWAIRKEIPFKTRANVLECSRNLRDEVFRHFSMLPQADGSGPANAAAPSAGSKRPAPTSAASSAAVTSTSADDAKKRMRTSTDFPPGMRGTPIIIVPSSAASLINMYNAKQFLEGGQWVPPETARVAAGSVEKPAKIEIHRTDSRGNQCKYYVTDNVNSLQPHDWLKVAAVFAAGPDWQFKGWKWGAKPDAEDVPPVKIFNRAIGFHLHFEDDAPHANCQKWAVDPLAISKTKRYLDPGVANKVWMALDNHIFVKKPFLLPKGAAMPGAGSTASAK